MKTEIQTKRRLIANRVAEKDIRDWLDKENFAGITAQFQELELHAIRSPGWEQVFRFTVEARPIDLDSSKKLFGVLRDDERQSNPLKQIRVQVFEDPSERESILEQWSEGMYVCKSGQNGTVLWTTFVFVLFIVVAIAASNLLN